MTTTNDDVPGLAGAGAVVAGVGGGGVTGRAWAYLGAVLGAVVSIAANVAHAYVPAAASAPGWRPDPGAVVAATFWPVALLVALEILARVQWPTAARWTAARWGGLLPVGLVAAVVSYRHLSGLLAHYGEDPITTAIGPLAVDGLMLIASGALLAGRPQPLGHQNHSEQAPGGQGQGEQDATPVPAEIGEPVAAEPVSAEPVTSPVTGPAKKTAPGRVGRSTGERVARLRAKDPGLSVSEIARRVGVSDRTVRRHLAAIPESGPDTGADTTPDTGTDIGQEEHGQEQEERAA